jgi:UTP-glucose-1-phosphate uridylyltransferase/mevalonate kinase
MKPSAAEHRSNSVEPFELFVPGRVCLFGEHSDWAGGYRRINANIDVGKTIICGTNQGLHARVSPLADRLVFRTRTDDGQEETLDVPMTAETLIPLAEEGGFWSYIAGTAFQILTHYHVGGIEIDNYRTDLPRKKGLSSSAAVCVLTARAFNRAYDLKMTVRGEMDAAYRGEITTPSRCGRMDQGCAYGNKPVLMTFDSDALDVTELSVGADLHYVIVDLMAKKDTVRILQDLNHSYPFPETDLDRSVHEFLGPINAQLVMEAQEAVHRGDGERLGALMEEAQREFDSHLGPACPTELAAPILHEAMQHPSIRPFVWGAKGVGSQGDGTAQFLARSREAQRRVMHIVQEQMGMEALALTIPRTKTISKAIITAAGSNLDIYPTSLVLRKELMPVPGKDGLLRPLIVQHVEDAILAGIEEIAIVVQPTERAQFERLFHESLDPESYRQIGGHGKAVCDRLEAIGRHVTLVDQPSPGGLLDAVAHCCEWVGDQPAVVVLGDHIFTSRGPESCIQQIIDVYRQTGGNTIGVETAEFEDAEQRGVVKVEDGPEANKSVVQLREKPSISEMQRNLVSSVGTETCVYAVFGLYALDARAMRALSKAGQDRDFTGWLDDLCRTDRVTAVAVNGSRRDVAEPLVLSRSGPNNVL